MSDLRPGYEVAKGGGSLEDLYRGENAVFEGKKLCKQNAICRKGKRQSERTII